MKIATKNIFYFNMELRNFFSLSMSTKNYNLKIMISKRLNFCDNYHIKTIVIYKIQEIIDNEPVIPINNSVFMIQN